MLLTTDLNILNFSIIFLFSIILFVISYKISSLLKIIDYPDNTRKLHKDPIVMSGGFFLIFILSIFNYIFFSELKTLPFKNYTIFIGAILFFLLGLADDKFNVTPTNKLFSSIIIILFILTYDNYLLIENLYLLNTLVYNFSNNNLSFFLTIFCFLLLINSLNMFDGINGSLLVHIIIIVFFTLFKFEYLNLSILFLLPLLIFLFSNVLNKVFLGSSGNMIIAYLIGVLLIFFYKNSNFNNIEFDFINIFSLFFLPVIETLRLFIYRTLSGKSPFSPDKNHFHHYLVKNFSLFTTNIILSFFILIDFITLLILFDIIYLIIFKLLIYFIFLFLYSKYLKN